MRHTSSESIARATRRAVPAAAVLALTAGLAACSLDTGVDLPAIAGEWVTVEYTLTNADNPSESVDVIPDLGWFEYVIVAGGGYFERNEWTLASGQWANQRGTWQNSQNTLTIFPTGSNTTVSWEWHTATDGGMDITVDAGRGWDFDGDGTKESTHDQLHVVSSDNNPDPNILGDWQADSYVITSIEQPDSSVDIIADGGSFTLSLVSTRTFHYQDQRPGPDGLVTDFGAGDIAATNGLLWLMDGDDVVMVRYTRSGDTLTLTGARGESWDFDGDGTEEDASFVITLSPQ